MSNNWYEEFCQWAKPYYEDEVDSNVVFKEKDSLENITQLDICDKNINEILPQIENLTKLVVVSASSNNIKELPLELFKLKSLNMLDLADNNISVIPHEIEKVNIFYLDISNNPIEELPPIFYKKKRISTLYLHNTNIKTIPKDICQLKNLTSLTFDDKHLPTVAKYLFSFPNIDSINLTESNYDETSEIIQNLGLKYDTEEWLCKEHKRENGVIKLLQKTIYDPQEDMEGMVDYGLDMVDTELDEGLRMYHEAITVYNLYERQYPLPHNILDLSIAIVLNIADTDMEQAINLLDIIEIEEFRIETIDKLIAKTDDEKYKRVLEGMK